MTNSKDVSNVKFERNVRYYIVASKVDEDIFKSLKIRTLHELTVESDTEAPLDLVAISGSSLNKLGDSGYHVEPASKIELVDRDIMFVTLSAPQGEPDDKPEDKDTKAAEPAPVADPKPETEPAELTKVRALINPPVPTSSERGVVNKVSQTQPVELNDPKMRVISTALKFTPYAWAKLNYICHAVDTEIGGMGIAYSDDPLLIEDIAIIPQKASRGGIEFEMDGWGAYQLEMCDPDGKHKLQPTHCTRIWIHTHPAGVNRPSGVDEATFAESFGNCDWSVMFILTREGTTYCRIQHLVAGMKVGTEIGVVTVWDKEFPESDQEGWRKEISDNVREAISYAPVKDEYLDQGWPSETTKDNVGAAKIKKPVNKLPDDFRYTGEGANDFWDAYERKQEDNRPGRTKMYPKLRFPHGTVFKGLTRPEFEDLIERNHGYYSMGHTVRTFLITAGIVVEKPVKSTDPSTLSRVVDKRKFSAPTSQAAVLDKALFNIDDAKYTDQIIYAEEQLLELTAARKPSVFGVYDIYGELIREYIIYVTQNTRVLYLSPDESDMIADVRAGTTTYDATMKEALAACSGKADEKLSEQEDTVVIERESLLEDVEILFAHLELDIPRGFNDCDLFGKRINMCYSHETALGESLILSTSEEDAMESVLSGKSSIETMIKAMFEPHRSTAQEFWDTLGHAIEDSEDSEDETEDESEEDGSFLEPGAEDLETGFYDGEGEHDNDVVAQRFVHQLLQDVDEEEIIIPSDIELYLEKSRVTAKIMGIENEFDVYVAHARDVGYYPNEFMNMVDSLMEEDHHHQQTQATLEEVNMSLQGD